MHLSMNDDELYSRYVAGDMEAGDTLMLSYADPLAAYLCSFIQNPQDAEDLMLECFTVILVDKPKIWEGCFRSFLYKIARHKACTLWKRILKRNEFYISEDTEFFLDQQEIPDERFVSPDEEVISGERNTLLYSCLNRIAPQYREALWLIYGMQFSYDESAKIMGCSRKRIDNMLMKGKKALKKELEKEGITYADI